MYTPFTRRVTTSAVSTLYMPRNLLGTTYFINQTWNSVIVDNIISHITIHCGTMSKEQPNGPRNRFEEIFNKLTKQREGNNGPSMICMIYNPETLDFEIKGRQESNKVHAGCNIASAKAQRVAIRGGDEEAAIDGGYLLKMFKFVEFQNGTIREGTIQERNGLDWDEDFPVTSALSKVLATQDPKWNLNDLWHDHKGRSARQWLRRTFSSNRDKTVATNAVLAAKRITSVWEEDSKFTAMVVQSIQRFVLVNQFIEE